MIVQPECTGVRLCRSALISHRSSRRLSSSIPAASLNDVKRLTAEDQGGNCHDD